MLAMGWVTGRTISKTLQVCWKIDGGTFFCESQRGSRSKTERRFGKRRKVQEKNGRKGEDRRNEDGDEKTGFEFRRDEIVKFDKKVSEKLPKLKINKFEGTVLDWFRSWNQFENEIDQVQISPISKISHLKELLVPKVKLLIAGLPFIFEAILTFQYRKPSEVAANHIHCITSLSVISNCSSNRIQEF